MEVITRQTVVDQLAAYLQHELALPSLVTWAETALMEGDFERQHFKEIRDAVAKLGVAYLRAFGLSGKTANNCFSNYATQPMSTSKQRDGKTFTQ